MILILKTWRRGLLFTTVHVCGNWVLSPSDGRMFGLPRHFLKWQRRGKKRKKVCFFVHARWLCGCRAAICSSDILWKMRDISSVMGLFLAPTVSNYNWCFHVFKSVPATCQYSLCPLKIPIMIKREYSEEKKEKRKIQRGQATNLPK